MTEPRQVLLIVTLLASMLVAGTLGLRSRSGAVVLALTGFTWLLVDTSYEGTTIWAISPTHGLTTSDLVGLLAMVIAAAQVWRLTRRR